MSEEKEQYGATLAGAPKRTGRSHAECKEMREKVCKFVKENPLMPREQVATRFGVTVANLKYMLNKGGLKNGRKPDKVKVAKGKPAFAKAAIGFAAIPGKLRALADEIETELNAMRERAQNLFL